MLNTKKINIVCLCGKLLENRNISKNTSASFTKKCDCCKKNIFIQIKNSEVFVSYK